MSLSLTRIVLLVLMALEGALLVFGPQAKDHLPAMEAALAAKEKPDWDDDASMGIRYAAWINLALLLGLLGTSRWWAKPWQKSVGEEGASGTVPLRNQKSKIIHPKWFWPLVLFAVVVCLSLRLPLASKSLWWDESWVVMQVTHGKWNPDKKKPGALKFQAHNWKRAAFYYQKPTNHVPMSLAQKASFGIWRALGGKERSEFNELAARLPALIASVAAVVLLALLLRQWGLPGAGVAAALLLALHPWHIRYGVDARAYALVVPLCVAGLFAVTRIFQTRGRAVWPWVAWGAIEFVWLWAYPNAVIDVAVLNLVLAYGVWRNSRQLWPTLLRVAAVNVFAAMAFIQMFLPNAMQALRWAGSETVSQPLNGALLDSTLSQLMFGVELSWPNTVEAAGLISSYAGLGFARFGPALVAVVLLLVLLSLGRKRLGPAGSEEPFRLLAWVFVSTAVYMGLVWASGSYFYPRFIIALLPCLVALICLLVAEAIRGPSLASGVSASFIHARRWVAVGLVVFVAVQVIPFWMAQTKLLTTRPYAPLRDVAQEVTAQAKEGAGSDVVCYGHGFETLPIYLPGLVGVVSKQQLEEAISKARAANRGLLVIQGHTVHNRGLIPDGFTLLDERNLFEEVKAFAGIEPEFYYRIFRLR